jgi:hypothetical protein
MSLTFITACAHCQQKFTTPGFGDLLGTESGQAKIADVFRALITHLQKKHLQECQKADLAAATLGGLLRLTNFKSDDPVAQQMREWNRHVIHEMTRAVTCPDNKIEEQVATLGLNEFTGLRVVTLIKQMRDIIEERGQFAPPDPTKTTNGQPQGGPRLVLP